MKKREIEQKLNNSFEKITPEILDSVKSECNFNKVKFIKAEEHKHAGRIRAATIAAAAALVLFTAGAFGIYGINNIKIAEVDLDVNPGIEISVNRKNRVIKADPTNADGKKILSDMDLKNTEMDVAVNAVLGSMLKNGYINDAANSVLLSVNCKNADKANDLTEKISLQIKKYLDNKGVESSVLSQNLNDDEKAVVKAADELNISRGRAKYILEIIKSNPLYKAEDLAELNINELNILSQKYKNSFKGVKAEGNPSDKAYISKSEAEEKAIEYLKLDASEVTDKEIEFDIEQVGGATVIIYEVELHSGNIEYEVEIDAETGKILNMEKEEKDSNDDEKNNPDDNDEDEDDDDDDDDAEDIIFDGNYITEEKARDIALVNAKFKIGEVKNLKYKLEQENNIVIYEVEFNKDGIEYEYEIDATSGEILNHSEEVED